MEGRSVRMVHGVQFHGRAMVAVVSSRVCSVLHGINGQHDPGGRRRCVSFSSLREISHVSIFIFQDQQDIIDRDSLSVTEGLERVMTLVSP